MGESVAEELVRLRKSTGLNRKEFAERMDIPYRTMQDWERGVAKMPPYVLRMIKNEVKEMTGNMAEERKGEPIEKWNAEINASDNDAALMADISKDGEGKARGEKFLELRESTGMNRKEFADYLSIPYRTMTEWERGNRIMPEYVYALIEYKVQAEFGLTPQEQKDKDTNALGNQMRNIEDMIEQNDNSFDGIINNLPDPETPAQKAEKGEEVRESVIKKLKDCVKILEDEKEKAPRTLCPDRDCCR